MQKRKLALFPSMNKRKAVAHDTTSENVGTLYTFHITIVWRNIHVEYLDT
jgi:hypothetical protein